MHIIAVERVTPFTRDPEMTAGLLGELVRRLGGDVTVTIDQLNANIKDDGDPDVTAMTYEPTERDENGMPKTLRIRILPLAESTKVFEALVAEEKALFEKLHGAEENGVVLK